MQFKRFLLKEYASFSKEDFLRWAKNFKADWMFKNAGMDQDNSVSAFFDDNGKRQAQAKEIVFKRDNFGESEMRFAIPFDAKLFGRFPSLGIAGTSSKSLVLDTFENLPDANDFQLNYTIVKSFTGIDKLRDLKEISMTEVKVNGGLLTLLKAPNLESVTATGGDDGLDKACKIVTQHLQHKDILELQNDLIDAGFDHWAKK